MHIPVFDSITVISLWPLHLSKLSLHSFNQLSAQYSLQTFFPSCWLPSHIIIVETMDNGERGMNPVAMTIINLQKEYWPSQGSNQRPPVLKSCTLPTELLDTTLAETKYIMRTDTRALNWSSIHDIGTYLMVPRSVSFAKVKGKYYGHQKAVLGGISISQT